MVHSEDQAGIVRADELYTLEALKKRLGIKDSTLRAARRAGLRVHYKHGRGFVHGRDWIAYVCSPNQPPRCDRDETGTQSQVPFPSQIPE